jgi:hypothetical protein
MTPEERLAGLSPEEVRKYIPPEEYLKGISPQERERLRRLLEEEARGTEPTTPSE